MLISNNDNGYSITIRNWKLLFNLLLLMMIILNNYDI